MGEVSVDLLGSVEGFLFIFSREGEFNEASKGRKFEEFTRDAFFLVEAEIISCEAIAKGAVMREATLDEHFAGKRASSCAAGDLGDELEGGFTRAEVGNV